MEVDDLFSGKYSAKSVAGIRPSADGVHYTCLSPDRTCIVRYAYATGEVVDTLLDVNRVPGQPVRSISGYSFGEDEDRMLIYTDVEMIYRRSFRAAYYFTRVGSHTLQPLSAQFPKQQIATLSPDGTRVAFVHANNIYVKNLADGSEVQITRDGEKNKILNGVTDWVYEEEFAQTRLMAWSPDSRALAFVRTDESDVQEYPMQLFCTPSGRYDDPQEVYPRYAGFKYPVAGADNSRITFNVWKEGDAATHPVVLPVDGETYLPAINVIPRTGEWVVTALNRLQNHIRLLAVDIEKETTRLLYEDTSDTYINEEDITSAVFYPIASWPFPRRPDTATSTSMATTANCNAPLPRESGRLPTITDAMPGATSITSRPRKDPSIARSIVSTRRAGVRNFPLNGGTMRRGSILHAPITSVDTAMLRRPLSIPSTTPVANGWCARSKTMPVSR